MYQKVRRSLGRAAEFAGMSRIEFLAALERYKVFPFTAELSDLENQNV
jgi:predicted HTH domain antitoxin